MMSECLIWAERASQCNCYDWVEIKRCNHCVKIDSVHRDPYYNLSFFVTVIHLRRTTSQQTH
jgi:hypothetical protein